MLRKWRIAVGTAALVAVAMLVTAHGVVRDSAPTGARSTCPNAPREPGQGIVLVAVDGSESTASVELRGEYAQAVSEVAQGAATQGSYLVIERFASSIAGIETICKTSTRVSAAAPLFADALAQARGLGVALTLAHQHLAQLHPAMRSAVLANARSQVCFQLANEDALAFARATRDLEADDFQRLGRFEVYLRLVAGGEVTGFASGRTLPPQAPISDPAQVRAVSRERYGRPIEEVEAEIRRLIEGEREDRGPLGKRPRRNA